jgi:hypothetical protein
MNIILKNIIYLKIYLNNIFLFLKFIFDINILKPSKTIKKIKLKKLILF